MRFGSFLILPGEDSIYFNWDSKDAIASEDGQEHNGYHNGYLFFLGRDTDVPIIFNCKYLTFCMTKMSLQCLGLENDELNFKKVFLK
jgi:hypothetical protein